MRKELKAFLLAGLLMSVNLVVSAYGDSTDGKVEGTRHDLTWVFNQDASHTVAFNDYDEICVYCHTPHGADSAGGPLWNRDLGSNVYEVYNSATMDTSPAATPSTLSLLCLSCHDGTSTADAVHNEPNSGVTTSSLHMRMMEGGDCGTCHRGDIATGAHDSTASYLGTDLSDDHPVSMPFPDSLDDSGFHTPPDANNGWTNVRLFEGLVECSSCHDVHDNRNAPFLVTSNSGSALCLVCHDK